MTMTITAEQARDRVMAYLRRRKLDRQVEQAVVHTYDASSDGEVSLLVDDLHTVIAQAEENARLRAKLEKAVEAIEAAETAVRQKVEMWSDDDGLSDWVKPGKIILADLLSVFTEITHD